MRGIFYSFITKPLLISKLLSKGGVFISDQTKERMEELRKGGEVTDTTVYGANTPSPEDIDTCQPKLHLHSLIW